MDVRLASPAVSKDRLTIEEYKAAKDSSVAVLRGSEEFSVPAKLKLSCREAAEAAGTAIRFCFKAL